MIKKISIIIFILLTQVTNAQKAQKVGYIDRDYILENVPEYTTAQSKLDGRIKNWNARLDKLKNEINALKLTLSNEKALLTADLIAEREEDIHIKQTELKRLQEAYYGTSGDLFMLRKQLVKPIQDQIFNAIQEISVKKKYDIIFDKSSEDMVMLYNNPKYDISELVLQKIVKGRKKKENAVKKSDKEEARAKKKEAIKEKAKTRLTKQEQLRERVRVQNEAKKAKREALKKAKQEAREKRKAALKAQREAKKNKGKIAVKNKENGKEIIDAKAERTKARKAKQEELKKAREEKIAKREAVKKAKQKEREQRKKALKEQREARLQKNKKATIIKENEEEKEKEKIPEVEKKKQENKEKVDEVLSEVKKEVKEEMPKEKVKTKQEIRAEKMRVLNERRSAKKTKRDSLHKLALKKRAKKMAEIEARKKKLEKKE